MIMPKNNLLTNKIDFINLALTSKCNLKCIMCDIWEQKGEQISLEIVEKLLSSKKLNNNVNISLTGGEPFLFQDFVSLFEIFKKYNRKIYSITTNGVLIDKIIKTIKILKLKNFEDVFAKNFVLNISVDGIKSLKNIRGISFENLSKNINALTNTFPDIKINIKTIMMNENLDEIIDLYKYAIKSNYEFKLKIIENQTNYTNKIKKINVTKEFKQKSIKELKKIFFEAIKYKDRVFILRIIEILNFLQNKIKKTECQTPFNRVFVMQNGDVYSCLYNKKIGNLHVQNFDDILNSKSAKSIRKNVLTNGCCKCIAFHGHSR